MYFYSQQEEDWLKDNVDIFVNSIGLADAFNARFTSNRKAHAIRKKISYLLSEHKFGHSGGKQVGFGSSVTASPVGSERWSGGYLYVKVADNPLPKKFTTADLRKNWVAKHRLVWEKERGKIPKDSIVVFLDGDRSNFDLNNLYCTNKKTTTAMIRNNWFSSNWEITLTAIKWCELLYTLKTAWQKNGTQ